MKKIVIMMILIMLTSLSFAIPEISSAIRLLAV